MNWTDEGLLLSVNPHGEKSAIIQVLTKTKGIQAGIIQNAFSRKMSSTIQPSNQLYLNWSSRLEEHLGTYKVFVNFIPVADITQIIPEIFKSVKRTAINIK